MSVMWRLESTDVQVDDERAGKVGRGLEAGSCTRQRASAGDGIAEIRRESLPDSVDASSRKRPRCNLSTRSGGAR